METLLNVILMHANSAAAIVVVLGLCLLCHEAGHFLLAKASGMRVDEFALGFGRAIWRRQRGETVYRLNILPLGGYVKIAGMEPGAADEPRGFHSRPRWQGALVIIAGSTANILLAVVLFTIVTAWQGVLDPRDHGIYVGKVLPHSPAWQAGLKSGDRLVAVDGDRYSLLIERMRPGLGQRAGLRPEMIITHVAGQEVHTPRELLAALRAHSGQTVPWAVIDFNAPSLTLQEKRLSLPVPPNVAATPLDKAADWLQAAYGLEFAPLSQTALVGYIATRPRQSVALTIVRGGRQFVLHVQTQTAYARLAERDASGRLYSRIAEIGRIGIVLRHATRPVGLGEAITLGAQRAGEAAASVLLSVGAMIRKEIAPELAGPVAIMAISAERARIGWDAVLGWGGTISAILAMINLFPLPPFDGYRLLLLGFEAIIRRRVDARVEWIASALGLMLILLLFVALTAKDLTNLLRFGTP